MRERELVAVCAGALGREIGVSHHTVGRSVRAPNASRGRERGATGGVVGYMASDACDADVSEWLRCVARGVRLWRMAAATEVERLEGERALIRGVGVRLFV
jgi:hypothetical protein